MDSVTKSPDAIIVSAFGRGQWICAELARRGWQTVFVDVTDAMGPWEPEDWEGPWGFFDTPELLPSQRASLLETDQAFPVGSGFTIWTQRGPLELSGPLTDFHLASFDVPESVREYLKPSPEAVPVVVVPAAEVRIERTGATAQTHGPTAGEPAPVENAPAESKLVENLSLGLNWTARAMRDVGLFAASTRVRAYSALRGLERSHRGVRALPFADAWLAQLAHAVGSIVRLENQDAISDGGPLPLLAPYGVRHRTRESHEESLAVLEELGVRVLRQATIEDVRVGTKGVDAIEVAAGRRGVETARCYVWTLTSAESGRFGSSVTTALYPEGAMEPEWSWARFRLRLSESPAARVLPIAFVLLENPFLSWTHSNLALIKRIREAKATPTSGQRPTIRLDAWIRVPVRLLKDRSRTEELGAELADRLRRRVPLCDAVCERLPIETEVWAGQSAEPAALAPRFGVFDPDEVSKFSPRSGRNLFFDSPEQWGGHDWMSRLRYAQAVDSAMERLKQVWLAAERRGDAQP